MKRALVIVDAWKYHDTRNQEKEANALCSFLNYVIQHERQKETTIIYSFGSVPLDTAKDPHNNKINSDSLNVNIVSQNDDIFTSKPELNDVIVKNNIEEVYFGGFHFGHCIHMHSEYLHRGNTPMNCKNIVLNLSMVLSEDSWDEQIKKHSDWNYHLWGATKFERIKG